MRKKRAAPQPVTLDDAVEEALCFGWIDSRLRPIDDERSAVMFSPRRPGSTWSRSNKQRAAALLSSGQMTEAGRRVVEAAQDDGSWTSLDAIEALQIPDDLANALAADPEAETRFNALPPSARKSALWWIASAKRPETRSRRIRGTVRRQS